MSDLGDLNEVCRILDAIGVTTERLPKVKTKCCDLRAHDRGGEHYLIEVKGFHDNANIRRALREDRVHVGARSLVESNVVDEGIEYAIKQFQATPMAAEVLWLVALMNHTVYGSDVTSKQIYASLYGIRPIVYVDSRGRNVSQDCLYFSHSAFHRHAELDGAIVIDPTGVALYVNDFGRRIERVHESVLGRYFAQQGALNNAAGLESRAFFWADCALDRNDEHGVLEYVRRKYALGRAMVWAPKEHSAMVGVARPRPKSDDDQNQ